ncbi:hypothetical protein D9M71_484210 [compost metagenome]
MNPAKFLDKRLHAQGKGATQVMLESHIPQCLALFHGQQYPVPVDAGAEQALAAGRVAQDECQRAAPLGHHPLQGRIGSLRRRKA